MTSKHDQDLHLLGALFREGRIRAQVPHVWITVGATTAAAETLESAHESSTKRLIENGLLAWKVSNSQPGRPKVLYTPEPINPLTQRPVSAYLWMTPLAVIRHGHELHALYTQAIANQKALYPQTEEPLPFKDFQSKLLLDTVPVGPGFESHVPADILAATRRPRKKPEGATGGSPTDPDVLGPRKSEDILHPRVSGQAFLDNLERWKAGPTTRLTDSRSKTSFEGHERIEGAVIASCGAAGVEWLVRKGFTPRFFWYACALSVRTPGATALLDQIKKLGVDPKALAGDRSGATLWHALEGNWSADKVAWLQREQVEWGIPDSSGRLPLAGLLRHLRSRLNTQDFFSMEAGGTGYTMGSLFAHLSSAAGSDLRTEQQKEQKKLTFLTELAVSMVQSGVDPFQKALDGSTPWQAICPEQTRAERLLGSRLPSNTPDPEGTVRQQLFFGDHQALVRDPEAYGPQLLGFIRRVEQAYGKPLLIRLRQTQP